MTNFGLSRVWFVLMSLVHNLKPSVQSRIHFLQIKRYHLRLIGLYQATILCFIYITICIIFKGQLISKAIYGLLTSPKKWSVCFFTLHGKQIKFLCSFFGRIYSSPICFSILSNLYSKAKLQLVFSSLNGH